VRAGDAKRAIPYAERALQLRQKVAAANPANAGARGDVATALSTMGAVWNGVGDRAAARRWYKQALTLFAELESRGQANANLKDEARIAAEAMARLGGL
jgi:tetratricopeptide (TPR) repeat protein